MESKRRRAAAWRSGEAHECGLLEVIFLSVACLNEGSLKTIQKSCRWFNASIKSGACCFNQCVNCPKASFCHPCTHHIMESSSSVLTSPWRPVQILEPQSSPAFCSWRRMSGSPHNSAPSLPVSGTKWRTPWMFRHFSVYPQRVPAEPHVVRRTRRGHCGLRWRSANGSNLM